VERIRFHVDASFSRRASKQEPRPSQRHGAFPAPPVRGGDHGCANAPSSGAVVQGGSSGRAFGRRGLARVARCRKGIGDRKLAGQSRGPCRAAEVGRRRREIGETSVASMDGDAEARKGRSQRSGCAEGPSGSCRWKAFRVGVGPRSFTGA
jgi:hypothetical protein